MVFNINNVFVLSSVLFCSRFVLIGFYYWDFKFEDMLNANDFFFLSLFFLLFLAPFLLLFLSLCSFVPQSPEWKCLQVQRLQPPHWSPGWSHGWYCHLALLKAVAFLSSSPNSYSCSVLSSWFKQQYSLSFLSNPSWVRSSFQRRPVQRLKLDGGETSGAEGPAFVLRHRTSNLIEHTTDSPPTNPMSPREKGDTSTSGSSTSHLSTAECPSHNGVSIQHRHRCFHLVGSEPCGVVWVDWSHSKTIRPKHTPSH